MFGIEWHWSFQFRLDFEICSASALWQKVLEGYLLLWMTKKGHIFLGRSVEKEPLALVPWIHGGIRLWLQCPWPCPAVLPPPANLDQHAWLLGRQHMHIFWRRWLASQRCSLKRRGARTDPCVTPFLRRRNRLRLPIPVVRLKLRFPTISMIMRTMIYQIAIAAACRWGRDTIQCRRLLWNRQTLSSISCVSRVTWTTVDLPCRNPACSCGSNWSMICSTRP